MAGFDNDQVFGETLALTRTSSGQWIFTDDGTDKFGYYNNAGTPESVVSANIGSLCVDTTNGNLYVKTTDTVNTGWVQLATGGGPATLEFLPDSGTSPVEPNGSGQISISGGTAIAGTTPLSFVGGSNLLTATAQISQALAAADATKVGFSNYDSASFAVDADGFVTMAGGGGFTWNDTSGAFSPVKNNGYFVTGTATGTLPASPSQGDTIKFFLDTTDILTIQASGSQIIRFGNTVSSAGGTILSTDQGDSIELTYRASNTCWCAIAGFSGNWSST